MQYLLRFRARRLLEPDWWRKVLIAQRNDDNVGNVEQNEGQPRPESSLEKVANRLLKHITENDENNGGRNNLAKSARGTDGSTRQSLVIVVLEHHRQGDQ